MSENNGDVIRVGRKGRRSFAFGETGEPFSLDVIEVNNEWSQIDGDFRDAEGKVPRDKLPELHAALWRFVRDKAKTEEITLAEAMEFMKCITEEAMRLKAFFTVKSVEKEPSSPESSTTLNFST